MTFNIYRQPNRIVTGSTINDTVFIRYSDGARLTDGAVQGALSRGIGVFDSAGVRILNMIVSGNGHDGQPKNGDGILDQAAGTEIGRCAIFRNGDNPDYEHGIYGAGTNSWYHHLNLVGNSCSGLKAMGTGRAEYLFISGSPLGVVFDSDVAGDFSLTHSVIQATKYAIQVDLNTRLARFHSDYNTFAAGSKFSNKGVVTDLAGWQKSTGLDLHSVLE